MYKNEIRLINRYKTIMLASVDSKKYITAVVFEKIPKS